MVPAIASQAKTRISPAIAQKGFILFYFIFKVDFSCIAMKQQSLGLKFQLNQELVQNFH